MEVVNSSHLNPKPMTQLPAEVQEEISQKATQWVFETNGHKWSNNDDTAPDNFGSYIAGATEYATKLQEAKELLKRMYEAVWYGFQPSQELINEINAFLNGTK
jgi:hypothetical protein